jgi:hypothetical protein
MPPMDSGRLHTDFLPTKNDDFLACDMATLPPKEASRQKKQCCFFLRIENTALPSTNKNIGSLGNDGFYP